MRCVRCYRRLLPSVACPRCHGAPLQSPRKERASPARVRGYEVLSFLASGGFSWVYRAVRTLDDRRVALKVGRPGTGPRFAREADALRKVSAPVVPELVDSGEADDARPWLALELLRGTSLAHRMASAQARGNFPLSQTNEWISKLASALDCVHRAGLVHRDLKPENIFVRRGDALVLLDFGLARAPGPQLPEEGWLHLTQSGQPLGTPLYMAPEQAAGVGDCGPEADVYSLGVIAFELLAGRPPFVGEVPEVLQAQLSLAPPRLGELARIPSAVEEVVHRCLEKEPRRRFCSAMELLESWRGACGSRKERSGQSRVPTGNALSILSADTSLPLSKVLPSIQAEGGKLSRIESGRYFFSFEGRSAMPATKRAAERLAQQLERSATLVIQSSNAQRSSRAPEQEPTPPVPASPIQSSEAVETPFTGRADLISSLLSDARKAWGGRSPLVTTLFGEVGLGKSRILAELGQRLRGEGVALLQVSAPPPERHAPEEATRKLLEALLGLPESPSSEVVRRLVPRSAGSAATDLAVELCLGLVPEEDRRARRLQQVPGAVRQATAEAICKLLWHRGKAGPTALLLDDAQWADPTCLDALEMAAMGESDSSLWICAAALPTLNGSRPFWCDRARSHTRHELSPMSADESRALLRELLQAVEFIPERVLAFLEEKAQGSPLALEESVAALRRRGAIRPHAGSQAWFVVVEEMAHRSDLPVYERISREVLDLLTPRLRSFAQICAAVGVELPVQEVAQAARSLQRFDERIFAGAWIDPEVGLSRLTRAGLLERLRPDCFAFRHPRLKDAVEATAPQLARETIHAALYALWAKHPSRAANLPRLAEHAQQCGARREALQAYFELAETSRLRHRYVEAAQQYSQALHQSEPAEHRLRYLALIGRGKTRYRLQQFNEALEDLRAAHALVETSGSATEVVEVLLEEATVLDWVEDWKASAECVDRAHKLIRRVKDRALRLRCELGVARGYVRRRKYRRAAKTLPGVLERARKAGDYEVQAISLLLLAFALVHVDPEQAASRFEEVISLCEAAGDALHLGSAYLNRFMLWARLQRPDLGVEDLRRANQQARWLGHAQLERFASYNLAECLFWQGQVDEAQPLARRAFELGVRFVGRHPSPLDALLLARIAHRSGDDAEARRWMQWISQLCPDEAFDPNARILHQALQLFTPPADGLPPAQERRAWRTLIHKAKVACGVEERRELAAYASAAATRRSVAQRPVTPARPGLLAKQPPSRHGHIKDSG